MNATGEVLMGLMAALLTATPVLAHEAHLHTPAGQVRAMARVSVPDVPLDTQAGRRITLPDLVGDRIVVIDFVYTSCTTFCPVASSIMDRVRDRLGERLGRDVVLVSITVDPVRDTPQRLAAYASRFVSSESWHWLTGDKRNVDAVLKGFGAYSPNFEDHPALVLVGHPRSAVWTRLNGLPDPDLILSQAGLVAQTVAERKKRGVR